MGDGLAADFRGLNADTYQAEHVTAFRLDWAGHAPCLDLRDQEGQGWLMFFAARAPSLEEANGGGATGSATSFDQITGTLQPPPFVGAFGQQ